MMVRKKCKKCLNVMLVALSVGGLYLIADYILRVMFELSGATLRWFTAGLIVITYYLFELYVEDKIMEA